MDRNWFYHLADYFIVASLSLFIHNMNSRIVQLDIKMWTTHHSSNTFFPKILVI